MSSFIPLLAGIVVSLAAAYFRIGLRAWSLASVVAIAAAGWLASSSMPSIALPLLAFALIALPLNLVDFRRRRLSAPLLAAFQKVTPQLSDTEQIALEAGTVGFEGELFSGKPDWSKLLQQPKPELSVEEQAFLDGPVEELCAMVNDWQITHELADLNPEIWDFLKKKKFFGMILPKEYGGLGFSALAHSAVLQKIAGISTTLVSTVAVPNSLGPGELLVHYGTNEQKDYYLPRLADGREVPCFALTGPYAGSDATSIPDYGIVCKGEWNGANVLGVRLTFDKRYITLAPVATIVGLAFRMHDPEHLLGDKEDLGITLALLPRETKGLEIGRRHLPLNIPFQNGPVRGKDVFVPLSQLIGGPDMAGQGWRMLVECLSVGRAISLPSNTAGGMRSGVAATGAYARIRKQFGIAIGRFEGVEEALARIGGYTYAVTGAVAGDGCSGRSRREAGGYRRRSRNTMQPNSHAKWPRTRWTCTAARGVILGPSNGIGRGWQGAPVAITVEGREHHDAQPDDLRPGRDPLPSVRAEGNAGDAHRRLSREAEDLRRRLVRPHRLRHLERGAQPRARAHLRQDRPRAGTRLHPALLPQVEPLRGSARAGGRHLDAGARRQTEVQGEAVRASGRRVVEPVHRQRDAEALRGPGAAGQRPALLAWAFHDCVYRMQTALDGVLRNFPVRPVAWVLRALVFPFGRREVPPSDRLGRRVAQLLTAPNEARTRLIGDIYMTPNANNPIGRIERAAARGDPGRAGRAQVPPGGQVRRAEGLRLRCAACRRGSEGRAQRCRDANCSRACARRRSSSFRSTIRCVRTRRRRASGRQAYVALGRLIRRTQ